MSDLDGAAAGPPDVPVDPVKVAALDSPRAERIAQAYYLHHVQHQTIRYTAQKLGCSVSTAWELAREGRDQARFLQQVPDDVKLALANGAGWLVGALAAEQEAIGGRVLDYAPVILKALEFEAKIRGALAAVKVAGDGVGGDGTVPNPVTVATMQAFLEKNGHLPWDNTAPPPSI